MARDATRSNQLARGGCPQFAHRTEWQSHHQSFGVDVGVEEGAAEIIQSVDHLQRRNFGGFLPAANCNLSASRVDGEHEFPSAEVVCEFLRCNSVDFAILNERRTDYYPARACVEHRSRSVDRADSAAKLAGKLFHKAINHRSIVPRAHGCIKVD